MPDYNPNSIWGSKKERSQVPAYTPPGDPTSYTDQSSLGGGSDAPRISPPAETGAAARKDPSFFKRHGLVLFAVGIILVIGVASYIYYLLLPAPAPKLAITFSDPGTIVVGVPFPLTVTVANDSNSAVNDAQLTLTLPQGLSFVASGTTPDERALMIPIGALNSQMIDPPQTIQIVATGDSPVAGTTQTVSAALTYGTVATAATQFQATAADTLTIGSQMALSLNYAAPSSIFSGQNFDLAVNYANISGQALSGVTLIMKYPPTYRYISASGSTPTDVADATFPIGDLAPNATGTLVITGNITGPDQAQYQLNGALEARWGGQEYPAITAPANFVVTPSPLSFSITVNGTSSYVAGLGDMLHYVLAYVNNSAVAFQAASIKATLTGQMFDLSSLTTNGSFNSKNNTITWYAANTPALASIAPGQSGSVDFGIGTKGSFPIKLPSDNNYQLSVAAQIQSPTVPPNTAGSSTVSVASITNKVGGVIALDAEGYTKEAAVRSIKNSGPYPPVVDQPTTYTIHWDIVNYSTEMKNVTVSAYLQSGTAYTGIATSTAPSSTLSYDAGTGLVTWTIPDVPATTGVLGAPYEAVFQVSNTPAVNEVGQQVTLLGQSTLTATDAFTGAAARGTAAPVTTQFRNDPSVADQTGAVVQ